MNQSLRIGIVGDYDPARPSHAATDAALDHAAAVLGRALDVSWLPTQLLDDDGYEDLLRPFAALWCSSGSPYQSMRGALRGIQFARERGRPFVGT